MILSVTIANRNTPDAGSGGFEHLPRRGARTVGVLIAIFRVALRLDDLDPLPVGLELVGQHHGQSGPNPRAHFGAMRHDGHEAGLVDGEIDVRRERRSGPCLGKGESPGSDMEAEHETREGAGSLDHRAAVHRHDAHAFVSAVALMASRIRR